jgi:hypothetical protein
MQGAWNNMKFENLRSSRNLFSFCLCLLSSAICFPGRSAVKPESSSLCDTQLIKNTLGKSTLLSCAKLGENDSIVYSLDQEEGATLHLFQKQSQGKIVTRKISGWGASVLGISDSKKILSEDRLLVVDPLDDTRWIVAIRTRAEHDVAWIYSWIFDTRNKLQTLSFENRKGIHEFLAHDPLAICTWNPQTREWKLRTGSKERLWKLDSSLTKFSEISK